MVSTFLDHPGPTRVISGPGSSDRLPEWIASAGACRVLLVTDAGLVAAGHPARIALALEGAGIAVRTYDMVVENPDMDSIDRCVAEAKAFGADAFVALGGGSSMDTAKGAALLCANGGSLMDFWHTGEEGVPLAPLVAIPTTAGTGSEMQSYAIISHPKTHRKMAIGTPHLAPRLAILDGVFSATLPQRVTALTGVDATSHAVEAAVTNIATDLGIAFAREAWERIRHAFPRVLDDPGDVLARQEMLLGAAGAGLAIEHGMLGAAHALANPLTALHGVPHGQAVGVMLPHVVRHNGGDASARRRYDVLGGVESVEEFCRAILIRTGLATTLSDLGVSADEIPHLAELAVEQWTAGFNPRPVNESTLADLYRAALD
ncbi:MAG: iron-containing alcohol dehydrogenase [Armatimonadota bacterium]